MNRLSLLLFVSLALSCKSAIITQQRLFTPGDKGSMSFKIPAGGLSLVVQPLRIQEREQLDSGPQIQPRTSPYTFEYETLNAEQEPMLRQRVQGFVHCDRPVDDQRELIRRCPGSRIVIDLRAGQQVPEYLRIKLGDPRTSKDLYFAVTFRAPQSHYRARLHGLRLAPHEKAALLDTAYADHQGQLQQLSSLSTLAPLGIAQRDYRDRVIYQDAAVATQSNPRFPSYARIGPNARIVVPLYQREVPVRVRSMPLSDASEYSVCWQPMAEPVEGRCYKAARSQSTDSTFSFPRGRLIFSAPQPMALDVEYPLAEQQKFHLADAVQQHPVHRLAEGQTLSVNLEQMQGHEYLPLRINVWALHQQESHPHPAFLDLKILAPDGHVRHQERLILDSRLSLLDRASSEAELLSQMNSFHVNANAGGGRLVISAGRDMMASFMLGRSSTPLYSRLQAGDVIRADSDREFWIPVQPQESTLKDMIFSYAWNRDAAVVEAQRVSFPSVEARPGSFALTPSHIQEMTWEGRRKAGHYIPLRPGVSSQVIVERGPILPMILFAPPQTKAALRVNGQTFWEGTSDKKALIGNLDVSQFPQNVPLQFNSQEGEIFVSGIRFAQNLSTVYGKRFYYAQNHASFRIQKDPPQQTVNIEVLLTEAPAENARVQVTLQRPQGYAQPLVLRDFTYLKRDYLIEPRRFVPDSFLLDGTRAELLTLPIPLRADMPPGEYLVNVTTSGMKGILLGASSQLPNFGVRIAAARGPVQGSGVVE
jgi:hypothetical protein